MAVDALSCVIIAFILTRINGVNMSLDLNRNAYGR